MVIKILKQSWLKFIIIPYIISLIFKISYSYYSKNIPFAHWDEIYWVGRSYFFEFFIKRDFNNRIWQSYESYDQPKLGEFFYGAWLYPLYLKEKEKSQKPFDYTTFLIKNGFYEIDEAYTKNYTHYKNTYKVIRFDHRMFGFPVDWVNRYGPDALKPLNLIYKARILNVFLLTCAVIFAYFFVLQFSGLLFATIFCIFYGFNSLIIDTALRAHSEALFLFTFNAAMLFMMLYFSKKKVIYLLLFSLFAGLNMSTKLNGIMLPGVFFAINTILLIFLKKEKVKQFLIGGLPMLACLIIFIALNPFTYSQPLKNVKYMFEHRWRHSINLATYFTESYIPPGTTRMWKILENFYFSKQTPYFNGVEIFKSFSQKEDYGIYLFVLFLLGLLYLLKQSFKNNIKTLVFLVSFVLIYMIMVYYLILDWSRYFVHLVLFFTVFQLFGMFTLIKYSYKLSKSLVKQLTIKTKEKVV